MTTPRVITVDGPAGSGRAFDGCDHGIAPFRPAGGGGPAVINHQQNGS